MAEPMGTGHAPGRVIGSGHVIRQGQGEALRVRPCSFGRRPARGPLGLEGQNVRGWVLPTSPRRGRRADEAASLQSPLEFTLGDIRSIRRVALWGLTDEHHGADTAPGTQSGSLLPPRPWGPNLCSETLPGQVLAVGVPPAALRGRFLRKAAQRKERSGAGRWSRPPSALSAASARFIACRVSVTRSSSPSGRRGPFAHPPGEGRLRRRAEAAVESGVQPARSSSGRPPTV